MSEDKPEIKTMSANMTGRRVDFGKPGVGEGLSWGIEVDIDISDSLVRARLQEYNFVIPKHITKITFLDLSPQEALPNKLRNIRSRIPQRSIVGSSAIGEVAAPAYPGNPKLEGLRRAFNSPNPTDHARIKALHNMITWGAGLIGGAEVKLFNEVLKKSKGDTLVVVHGHSRDLSTMSEQSSDQTVDKKGNIIQRRYNLVPIDAILERYNDPNKYSAITLHGCNVDRGEVKAKKVPVFYPRSAVHSGSRSGFIWEMSSGASIPE